MYEQTTSEHADEQAGGAGRNGTHGGTDNDSHNEESSQPSNRQPGSNDLEHDAGGDDDAMQGDSQGQAATDTSQESKELQLAKEIAADIAKAYSLSWPEKLEHNSKYRKFVPDVHVSGELKRLCVTKKTREPKFKAMFQEQFRTALQKEPENLEQFAVYVLLSAQCGKTSLKVPGTVLSTWQQNGWIEPDPSSNNDFIVTKLKDYRLYNPKEVEKKEKKKRAPSAHGQLGRASGKRPKTAPGGDTKAFQALVDELDSVHKQIIERLAEVGDEDLSDQVDKFTELINTIIPQGPF